MVELNTFKNVLYKTADTAQTFKEKLNERTSRQGYQFTDEVHEQIWAFVSGHERVAASENLIPTQLTDGNNSGQSSSAHEMSSGPPATPSVSSQPAENEMALTSEVLQNRPSVTSTEPSVTGSAAPLMLAPPRTQSVLERSSTENAPLVPYREGDAQNLSIVTSTLADANIIRALTTTMSLETQASDIFAVFNQILNQELRPEAQQRKIAELLAKMPILIENVKKMAIENQRLREETQRKSGLIEGQKHIASALSNLNDPKIVFTVLALACIVGYMMSSNISRILGWLPQMKDYPNKGQWALAWIGIGITTEQMQNNEINTLNNMLKESEAKVKELKTIQSVLEGNITSLNSTIQDAQGAYQELSSVCMRTAAVACELLKSQVAYSGNATSLVNTTEQCFKENMMTRTEIVTSYMYHIVTTVEMINLSMENATAIIAAAGPNMDELHKQIAEKDGRDTQQPRELAYTYDMTFETLFDPKKQNYPPPIQLVTKGASNFQFMMLAAAQLVNKTPTYVPSPTFTAALPMMAKLTEKSNDGASEDIMTWFYGPSPYTDIVRVLEAIMVCMQYLQKTHPITKSNIH